MIAGRNSKSQQKNYNTPEEYLLLVRELFDVIELDPCSNDFSLVGANIEYKSPLNGLKESWNYNTIFVNPPYGRDGNNSIKYWLEKCSKTYKQYNSEIIALIPVATNTKHWQENIFINASSICFLKVPRLKFWLNGQEVKKGAPMACCFVYWGKNKEKFKDIFSLLGKIVLL